MADWQSVYESQFADGTLGSRQLWAQVAWGSIVVFAKDDPLRISCLHFSRAHLFPGRVLLSETHLQ